MWSLACTVGWLATGKHPEQCDVPYTRETLDKYVHRLPSKIHSAFVTCFEMDTTKRATTSALLELIREQNRRSNALVSDHYDQIFFALIAATKMSAPFAMWAFIVTLLLLVHLVSAFQQVFIAVLLVRYYAFGYSWFTLRNSVLVFVAQFVASLFLHPNWGPLYDCVANTFLFWLTSVVITMSLVPQVFPVHFTFRGIRLHTSGSHFGLSFT